MTQARARATARARARSLALGGLAALALSLAAATGPAQAHEYYAEGFTFVHPWAHPTAPGATDAAVYFRLDNVRRDDRLLSASSRLAERVELRADDDASAPALASIAVTPADQALFGPGRPHLLLRGLVTPLQWGRNYDLRVVFEKAGAMDVQISIGGH